VTHDQAEAMALADRLVVMDKGRIAQIGTPRDIWFNPADRFVASFIGVTASLPGKVQDGILHVADTSLRWHAPDGPVQVMLRPHALRLARGTEGMQGVVRAAQFLGDRTRITVALADDALLSLDAEAGAVAAPGDIVRIAIDPAVLIVLPESAAP
jgi:putative spermidine/putrescine transport system ATP-binding protein